MTETRTYFFDAHGNEVEDESKAVHGLTVEVDEHGNKLRELEKWDIGSGPGSGYHSDNAA
jgi:hypothetical protein